MQCWQCRKQLDPLPPGQKPARSDECPHCAAALHCCNACSFYDAAAHHECREPQADWVKEKDKPNFCDYFRIVEGSRAQEAGQQSRRKAEDLWARLTKKGAP